MRIIIYFLLFFLLGSNIFSSCQEEANPASTPTETFKGEIKVLALNTWHNGSQIHNGLLAVSRVILESEADIVLLSELPDSNNDFIQKLQADLSIKGLEFSVYHPGGSTGILSRFDISSVSATRSDYLIKCIVDIDAKTRLSLYAAHLDYTKYACYLPRGYSGTNWEKLSAPILDVDYILERNLMSQRDEAIAVFLKSAQNDLNMGNMVILGGDFNEPSHLDWTEAMGGYFDHQNLVIEWQNSRSLAQAGFKDSYRDMYPDPVIYPGITWPALNDQVALEKLVWTPEADDRERIDFIYYYPDERWRLKDVEIVGPIGSLAYGKPVLNNPGSDPIITPSGSWPSDHKAVKAILEIN